MRNNFFNLIKFSNECYSEKDDKMKKNKLQNEAIQYKNNF
jgi:hypothetical protein